MGKESQPLGFTFNNDEQKQSVDLTINAYYINFNLRRDLKLSDEDAIFLQGILNGISSSQSEKKKNVFLYRLENGYYIPAPFIQDDYVSEKNTEKRQERRYVSKIKPVFKQLKKQHPSNTSVIVELRNALIQFYERFFRLRDELAETLRTNIGPALLDYKIKNTQKFHSRELKSYFFNPYPKIYDSPTKKTEEADLDNDEVHTLFRGRSPCSSRVSDYFFYTSRIRAQTASGRRATSMFKLLAGPYGDYEIALWKSAARMLLIRHKNLDLNSKNNQGDWIRVNYSFPKLAQVLTGMTKIPGTFPDKLALILYQPQFDVFLRHMI